MPDLPRSITRAPEWVGEGDARRDASAMNERAIALAALDAVLRLTNLLKTHSDAFREFKQEYEDDKIKIMTDLVNHDRRIAALEVGRPSRPGHAPRVLSHEDEPEPSSWHDYDQAIMDARAELSRRVKDPKDRLDSIRAREIAEEVVRGVKTADDAQTFRVIKSRGWSVALEVAKWLAAIVIITLAARCGLHIPG